MWTLKLTTISDIKQDLIVLGLIVFVIQSIVKVGVCFYYGALFAMFCATLDEHNLIVLLNHVARYVTITFVA